MPNTKFCEGLSDISDSYMGFIIDQWGVLHDGKKVYDGVIEVLKELKERKKQVIILSNSGKRSEASKARLKKLGIGPSLYKEIVTSGEMTWRSIDEGTDEPFNKLGSKCLLLTKNDDYSYVDGLDLDFVDHGDEADFILIMASDAPRKSLEDYEDDLKKAARKRIPAICANPDVLGLMGTETMLGAGSIAKRYQDFGGVVHYIGKPHKPIYQYCLKRMDGILPARTIAIGDSMAHDIRGGYDMGIDTCLVKNGVHGNAFRNAPNLKAEDKTLDLLIQNYGVQPTYMVNSFTWGKALPDRKHRKPRKKKAVDTTTSK